MWTASDLRKRRERTVQSMWKTRGAFLEEEAWGDQKYLASRAVQGLLVLNPVRIEAWPLSGKDLLRVTVPFGASWLLMSFLSA